MNELITTNLKLNGSRSTKQVQWAILLVLTIFSTGAFAQWSTQSPVPTYLDVRGVAAPTAQRVFIATDDNSFDQGGALFESNDGGATWVQRDIPETLSNPLNRIFFLDSQHGWVYGNENYRTIDGGTAWTQISSGTGSSLNDADLFPGGNLVAVGEYGTVLTSDGTSPWIIREKFSTNHIIAVHVIGSQNVAAVDEGGQVFTSTDGGVNWAQTTGTPESLPSAEDIHFTTLLDGWVIGQSFSTGALYHTTDGGASWSQGELPGSPHSIKDMDFFNENVGYAVGWWGEVFRSSDGGETWDIVATPDNSVNFTDLYL
jgi:photosystem II stability/assembly factor-like uncharacterized protein